MTFVGLFSGYTKAFFTPLVKPEEEVEMFCVFGHADVLTDVTWYRNRPTGRAEKIVTFHHPRDVLISQELSRFPERISTDHTQDSFTRNHSFMLLDVHSYDIGEYWCEIKPDIFNATWRSSELKVEGSTILITFVRIIITVNII